MKHLDHITKDKILTQIHFVAIVLVAILVWAVFAIFTNVKPTIKNAFGLIGSWVERK